MPDIVLTLVQARRVYFKQVRLFSIQDIPHIDWTRLVWPVLIVRLQVTLTIISDNPLG